jgi:tetratricopeptide (TPR) repeat protein
VNAELDLDIEGRIAPFLDRLEAAGGVAEKRYARALLDRALATADPEALSDAEAKRALVLGASPDAVAAARRARSPHAVRVPLIMSDGRAIVRMFEVSFEAVDGRVALDAVADGACRDAVAAAAMRLTARPDARRYRFVPCAPLSFEHVQIDGPSLGAACFVSALALFSDRAVREGIVVTGAIEGDRIASVGGLRAKSIAAHAIGASRVIVPAADVTDATDVEGVATLDALADLALEPRTLATSPDALVERAARAARDGWSGYRWRSVRETTTRALAIVPEGRPDLRVDALAQLAAASRHLGDLAGSARAIELAVEIAESAVGRMGVPDEVLCRLMRQRAMHERGGGHLALASKAAQRGVAIARRARLRGELYKGLGVVGLIALARGRASRAMAPLEEALEITLERTPNDTARSRAYLVEALGQLGRIDEAIAEAEVALDECATEGDRGRAKEAWVRTSLGAALAACERWAEVRAALDRPAVLHAIAHDPLPGLTARRWLGVALCRTNEAARGSSLLASSGFAYGEAIEPALRFAANVNVVFDAAERARRGAHDPLLARDAITQLASHEAARDILARKIDAAMRALGSPARSIRALTTLAHDAARLA